MEGSPRPSVKDAPENDIHSLVVPSYIWLAENVGMGAYGIPYMSHSLYRDYIWDYYRGY